MERSKRRCVGAAFILVPIVMVFGFAAHPNLGDVEVSTGVQKWVGEFHNNEMWRLAHIAVMWAAPLIAVIYLEWMRLMKDKAPVLSFVAGVLGIIGCFMLAADKGALALVPTAFDTMPEDTFRQLLPGLQAMIEYRGYLWMAQLYILMPIAFVLMATALVRTNAVPLRQGFAVGFGGLLLLNPDIDLISLIASVVLAIGLVPMGVAVFRSA
jgi:hypothetical protein